MFLLRIFNIIFSLLSIPVLFSDRISPGFFWLIGFVSYLIPVVLVVNLLFFIFWLLRKSAFVMVSLTPLMIGYPFLLRTVTFHQNEENKGDLSVLSYNVRVFNTYAHLNHNNSQEPVEMIRWVSEENSDIKCLQEYYNDDDSDIYNTFEKISQKGKYHYYFTKTVVNKKGNVFGICIFSRYPIISKGNIEFKSARNKGVYADVVVKTDTLRIINVHFESMSIDEKELLNYEEYENKKSQLKTLRNRLEEGFSKRPAQLNEVLKYVDNSPYKVILCGDLNDIPYSYTYRMLGQKLKNSFENAGNGFGFTYNGSLFFLRIDNQFYDKKLTIHKFETLTDIKFSDHYPVKGIYSIPQ